MTANSRFIVVAFTTVLAVQGRPLAAQCPRDSGTALSTERPDARRPRVGLVLGGGGARGAAHVGVLQVLEELNLPVDFVVGTSMGAIVGGLYAAGVSPDSMERWVRRADWDDLFRDAPRYSELSFRRKEDAKAFPMPLVVGVGADGLQLPTGLIAGQKLNLALRSLTFQAARVSDFDSLAVPFRAVATDLETGTLTVFSQGDLVDAMRASMSVPGVFTPYPVDRRLYVDGGLVQNLPVEVACALGADVVIAVDVGSRLADPSELHGVLDITSQVTRIVTRSGSDREIAGLGPSDVLIQPDLGEISSTDFGRSLDAVAAGRAAARAVGEKLAPLAVDSAAFQRAQAGRAAFGEPTKNVDFVVLGAYSGRSPGNLVRRLATRPGPLDTAVVTRDIEDLYGLGIYERVDYRIVETEEGDALMLLVREKPWVPWYMRLRLSISDRLGSEGTYSLATELLIPQVNDWGAELVTGVEIGARGSLAAEFYQPLGAGSRFFVAPWFWFQSTPVDIVVGERPVARYRTAFTAVGLRAGVHPGSDTEIAVGIERGDLHGKPAIGTTTLEGFSARTGIVRLTVDVDGMDDPQFPRRGAGLALDVQAARQGLGSTDNYERADVVLLGAVTFGRTTIFGTGMAASALNSALPGHSLLGLGGFLLMSGYRPGELYGNHLGFGRLMVSRELGDDRAYLGVSLETGNVWQDRSQIGLADLRYSLAATLGLRTLLGPVYLGIGTRGSGKPYFYMEVGRTL
ncbi:MAG: patatin-like phospholipase family protein [Gemmatimonadota bacterium]